MVFNVLCCVPLTQQSIELLASTDGIDFIYAPDLMPTRRFAGDTQGEQYDWTVDDRGVRWTELLSRAQVLYGVPGGTRQGLAAAVAAAPNLSWVQTIRSGVTDLVADGQDLVSELGRVRLTSTRGIHAGMLSEYCLMGMLYFNKDVPGMVRDQQDHNWRQHSIGQLYGTKAVILGLGSIGHRIAEVLVALGVEVVGVRRSLAPLAGLDVRVVQDCSLKDEVVDARFLVISAPLTDQTRGLVSREVLEGAKSGMCVVNVGRGEIVDEAALVDLLTTGHIGGAALDVCAKEPLPETSALWDLPNVLLSGHNAARAAELEGLLVKLFRANLVRFSTGDELINEVFSSSSG